MVSTWLLRYNGKNCDNVDNPFLVFNLNIRKTVRARVIKSKLLIPFAKSSLDILESIEYKSVSHSS